MALRALDAMERAAAAAVRDRAIAAELAMLLAHAVVRNASEEVEGSGGAMGLKLRARAAADGARATDRASIIAAARGAQALLTELSVSVRFSAAAALAKLAVLLVAAEATFTAGAVAAQIGDVDDDEAGGSLRTSTRPTYHRSAESARLLSIRLKVSRALISVQVLHLNDPPARAGAGASPRCGGSATPTTGRRRAARGTTT